MKLPEQPFSSYVAKAALIDAAWKECEQRFASLPAPLRDLATQFLHSVADASGSYRSYFSTPLAPPLLYMPIWLFDGLAAHRLESDRARQSLHSILVGTIQGYIGIRLQDDVVDDPAGADPTMLLLGNVCFSGMTRAYADALGSTSSTFWTAFDRAFVDFSHFTLAEQHAVRNDEPYSIEMFQQHANKVAFARVPMLAVAALHDRMDLASLIDKLIHQLGIAYGIINDVIGWRRDVRAGHRTWLLAAAGLSMADVHQTRAITAPTERDARLEMLAEKLRPALYEGRLLNDAIERAVVVHQEALPTASALGMHDFASFTRERSEWLHAAKTQIALITLQRALMKPTN